MLRVVHDQLDKLSGMSLELFSLARAFETVGNFHVALRLRSFGEELLTANEKIRDAVHTESAKNVQAVEESSQVFWRLAMNVDVDSLRKNTEALWAADDAKIAELLDGA